MQGRGKDAEYSVNFTQKYIFDKLQVIFGTSCTKLKTQLNPEFK